MSDLKSSLSFFFYFHSLDLLNNFKQMICYFCDSQNFLSHLEHLSSNNFLDRSTQWQCFWITVTGRRRVKTWADGSAIVDDLEPKWSVMNESGRSFDQIYGFYGDIDVKDLLHLLENLNWYVETWIIMISWILNIYAKLNWIDFASISKTKYRNF